MGNWSREVSFDEKTLTMIHSKPKRMKKIRNGGRGVVAKTASLLDDNQGGGRDFG